jgi:hypothetical protein
MPRLAVIVTGHLLWHITCTLYLVFGQHLVCSIPCLYSVKIGHITSPANFIAFTKLSYALSFLSVIVSAQADPRVVLGQLQSNLPNE